MGFGDNRFLKWMGCKQFKFLVQKRREIYETFTFEPGDEVKLAPVLNKLSEYVTWENVTIFLPQVFHIEAARGSRLQQFCDWIKVKFWMLIW